MPQGYLASAVRRLEPLWSGQSSKVLAMKPELMESGTSAG